MTVLPLESSVLIFAPMPRIFFFFLRIMPVVYVSQIIAYKIIKRVLSNTEFVACSKQVVLLNSTSQAQLLVTAISQKNKMHIFARLTYYFLYKETLLTKRRIQRQLYSSLSSSVTT